MYLSFLNLYFFLYFLSQDGVPEGDTLETWIKEFDADSNGEVGEVNSQPLQPLILPLFSSVFPSYPLSFPPLSPTLPFSVSPFSPLSYVVHYSPFFTHYCPIFCSISPPFPFPPGRVPERHESLGEESEQPGKAKE